jgi:multidrug efflux system membrane fusion protein
MSDGEAEKRAKNVNGAPGAGRRWWIVVLVFCLVAGIALYGKVKSDRAASAQQSAPRQARSIPVAVTPAKKGEMNIYIDGLGSVYPLNTVTVRSRVDGQLMDVLFTEGQYVSKGQLLARIDPRPFQVQLSQAEGQMAHDEALLKNARTDHERYKVLWKQDSIPKQQLDTQEALVRQYEGALKTDQAQIDNAKLQLTYSRITSPIAGRTGLRLVDPGNMVRASDTGGLVVITQLQPITVVFPIPQDSIPPVITALNKGRRLTVEVFNREQTQKIATGTLLTADNQIDPATGTVKLKAAFSNKANELYPNQFVNARLLIDTRKDTLIIPSAAVQRGPQGTYVYVVKPDRTASVRQVTLGEVQGSDTSIRSGLAEGDLVVVDGAERLREGARVDIKGQGRPGARPGRDIGRDRGR